MSTEPGAGHYIEFIHRQEPDVVKRFGIFHSDKYSNVRNEAESLVLATTKKKSLAIGHIIHFLLDKDVAVHIKKTIYVKRGKHNVYAPGDVLRLRSTKNKNTAIETLTGGQYWKALSRWETDFVRDVIAHVKANE